MKLPAALLLTGLLSPALLLQQQEPPEKSRDAVTRFFEDEAERLAKELEGSWMLLDYTDPITPVPQDTTSGFATFHAGFLTWILAVDSAEDTLFGLREFLIVESGAFRYRIDEQTNLQLDSVLSFTNNTEEGEMERDPSGMSFEYLTKLEEGVLELRDSDGIVMTFRKVEAGTFPESAVRRIDRHRSGTESWEDEGDR